MARTNNLLNFIQDISLAIQQKVGDYTPIKIEEITKKISDITNDNTINGIKKEFIQSNQYDFTIGQFVSKTEDNILIPFDKKIYGIITDIDNNKITVVIPHQGGEQI